MRTLEEENERLEAAINVLQLILKELKKENEILKTTIKILQETRYDKSY